MSKTTLNLETNEIAQQPISTVIIPLTKTDGALTKTDAEKLPATKPLGRPAADQSWHLSEMGPRPSLLQRALQFVYASPGLAILLVGLSVTTLSLGTWVGALYLENKVLKLRLQQQSAPPSESAQEIKSRITEAQQQMSELQTQMEQQQTDQIITEQATLAGENARLLQDLNDLSKPQVGAPVVAIAPNTVKQTADPTKKDLSTNVDLPPNLALFTVILQQPNQDKTQPIAAQDYFIELTNQKGKGVTWSEKLLKSTATDIPLTFAKRSLAAGKYRLRLFKLAGKKKDLLDQYDLQVNYLNPPPPPKKAGKKK